MGTAEVASYLERLFRGLLGGTIPRSAEPPEDIVPLCDDLLSAVTAKRDAAIIHLAYAVDEGSPEAIGVATDGQRSVSQNLDTLLSELHIEHRKEAFQTVAKGSTDLLNLSGRSRPGRAFSALLSTARTKSIDEVRQTLQYLVEQVAATARHLPAMPALDVRRCTFRRVTEVVDTLLSRPSRGAHEQFVFAGLLHAHAEEHGARRVSTQNLNAADASSGSAADVSVWDGGLLVEGYEITANPWHTKIWKAAAVLLEHDLKRSHIVAPGPPPTADEIREAVANATLPPGVIAEDLDLSVIDVRSECRSLVHRLSRPGRRAALTKIREHLVERGNDDSLVIAYTELLGEAGLASED